jgi:hypothetical protein
MAGDTTDVPPRTHDRERHGSTARRTAARILGLRVPLWTLLGTTLAALVAIGIVTLGTDDEVNLGPAIRDAERVEATVVVCNEVVDAKDIDPRDAERDAQSALRELGAEEAEVRVEPTDCDPVSAP